MVQGNFKRNGAGCDTDNGSRSDTSTIEPEVLPAGSVTRMNLPAAPGANGMVDCRIFYFLLGAVVAGGFMFYCNHRRDGR